MDFDLIDNKTTLILSKKVQIEKSWKIGFFI